MLKLLNMTQDWTCRAGGIVGDLDITPDSVMKKLTELRRESTPDVAGLHPCIRREAAFTASFLLSDIFRKTLDTGVLPRGWKKTDMLRIF